MIYLIAILLILGIVLTGWVKWMGRGPYDADTDMILVLPMLLSLALIATSLILTIGWGAWSVLFH